MNGDGKTDQFLTFYISFADIVSALAAKKLHSSASSVMQLVAATATQPNSLNQDLNGVNGGTGSNQSWSQLGAFSQGYTPNGVNPVPEPATSTVLIASLAFLVMIQRTGRRKC